MIKIVTILLETRPISAYIKALWREPDEPIKQYFRVSSQLLQIYTHINRMQMCRMAWVCMCIRVWDLWMSNENTLCILFVPFESFVRWLPFVKSYQESSTLLASMFAVHTISGYEWHFQFVDIWLITCFLFFFYFYHWQFYEFIAISIQWVRKDSTIEWQAGWLHGNEKENGR